MKKIKVLKEFYDKTTAEEIKDQKLLKVDEIIECEDKLADSRIALGLAEEVSSKTKDKGKKEEE